MCSYVRKLKFVIGGLKYQWMCTGTKKYSSLTGLWLKMSEESFFQKVFESGPPLPVGKMGYSPGAPVIQGRLRIKYVEMVFSLQFWGQKFLSGSSPGRARAEGIIRGRFRLFLLCPHRRKRNKTLTYEAVGATTDQSTLKTFFFLFYMVSRALWNTLLLLIQFRKNLG